MSFQLITSHSCSLLDVSFPHPNCHLTLSLILVLLHTLRQQFRGQPSGSAFQKNNSELLSKDRIISEEILNNSSCLLEREWRRWHHFVINKTTRAKEIVFELTIIYEEFIYSLTKLQKSLELSNIPFPWVLQSISNNRLRGVIWRVD